MDEERRNMNPDDLTDAGTTEEGASGTSSASSSTGNGSYQYSASGNRFYQDDTYYDSSDRRTGTGTETRRPEAEETWRRSEADEGCRAEAAAGAERKAAPRRRKRRLGAGKAILAVCLAVVFGVSVGAGIWGISNISAMKAAAGSRQAVQQEAEPETEAENALADSEESSGGTSTRLSVGSSDTVVTGITQVASKVMPSIVSVYNNYTEAIRYFGQTYTQNGTSTGSGIIVAKTDDELLIVTNNHVVQDADSLSVQFIDEKNCDAAIKGTDAGNDLAVIAVSLDDLDQDTLDAISVATIGDSDNLQIGEPAIAIGNALGYGQSVTVGYVSALNRSITTEDGNTNTFIQTDAAINPGNSGGALVNINGEVIGINSNKLGGNSVEGMGFAIPITRAQPIIEDLMNQTTRTKVAEDKQGTLGINGVTVTSDVASAYGMSQGVYISGIIEGGAAEKAGLQKGDVITALGGSSFTDMDGLKRQLQYYEAGTEVTVTIQRQNENGEYESMDIQVTLGDQETLRSYEKQQQEQQGQQDQEQGSQGGGFYFNPFGN